MPAKALLSVVVPVYNEAEGLATFQTSLIKVLDKLSVYNYEIIYCDDGSTDQTTDLIKQWSVANAQVKLVRLSRNFGKESALAAGLAQAQGQAVITLDGDGQYPVELIPNFVAAWQAGAQVVIGVRSDYQTSFGKQLFSSLFYWLFNRLSSQPLLPGSTDFRLIDHEVQQAFSQLPESDRISRGLIDWLGFDRQLIYFKTAPRLAGSASYNRRQLIKLAANSFVSLTPRPLYLFGYLGVFITVAAFILGLAVLIEQIMLNDPWHWRFTGTAQLGILTLFLVGIILMSQGMLSLYISHIHNQTKQRPLYIINRARSAGLKDQ